MATEEMSSVCDLKKAVCVPGEPKSSVVPEGKSTDLRVATPAMAESASDTGSSSTPQQGDVADIVASVAELSLHVNNLAQMVRDMSKHVSGAGAREQVQLNCQRPDGVEVSSVTSRAWESSETIFGNFM